MSTDIMSNRQNVDRQNVDRQNALCMQNTEETIAKYAVDANLFRLRYINPKKRQPLDLFWWRAKLPTKIYFLILICGVKLLRGAIVLRGIFPGDLFTGD